MKLLIGTLYCGENEFDECIASIRRQTYKNFDHIVIQDLPELEAHYKLYKTFLDNKDRYGLLIKVDADVVLNSDALFSGIVEKFSSNPHLEVMNIGVDDFFTAEMIAAGIQVYRNTVRWDFSKDTLFPDIPILDQDRYMYDKTELAPAAIHCKNPSPYQAFHYGVHRGLKSIQRIHSTTHWALLKKVWNNFLKTNDKRMGLAVLGAELVYAGEFSREEANYTHPKMIRILSKYQELAPLDIQRKIKRLRLLHWGLLPDKYRQKILRFLRGRVEGRWDK